MKWQNINHLSVALRVGSFFIITCKHELPGSISGGGDASSTLYGALMGALFLGIFKKEVKPLAKPDKKTEAI
jgi:hypothetical protein